MEHFIYKTTNNLNGCFYIGMHSTENANDGYLGSGRRIKAEVKKYGKENFVREILEYLSSRESLEKREAEIVTEDLLKDPLCLNLKNGGEGGGKFRDKEHQQKCAAAGGRVGGKIALQITNRNKVARAKAVETKRRNGTLYTQGMLGKLHSDVTKERMTLSGSGEKNSQFGTCWVTDGVKPVKIKKEQLDSYLARGFIRGRKFGG